MRRAKPEIGSSVARFATRCSSSFFAEERAALERKRDKLRLLQQRKVSHLDDYKDLPEEIPMPLVIGTKVTGEEVAGSGGA